jgi:tRNA nucleotidyltransferase/poly(A) polymerase
MGDSMLNDALNLIKKINSKGYEAYIVGGFPRDYYMGITSCDVDIATNATYNEITTIFPNHNLSTSKYGSFRMTYRKTIFEITTYRKEISYKNRHPEFVKINSLKEDLKRRDFTINTLCIDESGNYVDYLNAKKDIENKILRSVQNPKKLLKDDPLRMLRAIRFAGNLGLRIENKLGNTIKKQSHLIQNVSFYKKKEELNKMFLSKNLDETINLLREYNIIKFLDIKGLEKLKKTNDLIGMWAQLEAPKYPFTKHEIKTKNDLSKIDSITMYNIYKFGLYICEIKAQILGFELQELIRLYRLMPIKTRQEIDIKPEEVIDVFALDGFKISKFYEHLEKEILRGIITNEKKDIIEKMIMKEEEWKN